jgi:type IV pilus assembly protein PilC
MAVFAYRARTSDGRLEEGQVEAPTRDEARKELADRGLFLQSLEPLDEKLSSGRRRRAPNAAAEPAPRDPAQPAAPGLASMFVFVPIMQRCAFWRQAAHTQRAGMTVHELMDAMAEGFGRLSRFCREAASTVAAGTPLSQILAGEPTLFSHLEVAMVRAGEVNGRLDTQMERLAQRFEQEMEVRNMLRFRLYYLGCVVFVMLCSMFCVGVIAPLIMAYNTGKPLGVLGKLVSFGLPIAVIIFLAISARGVHATNQAARRKVDQAKLMMPVLGPLFRKIAVARYLRALGDLIGAGLMSGEAAEIAAPVCGNLYLLDILTALPDKLRGGQALSDCLIATCQMPRQAVQMVRTGETTGSVDQMLAKVADYYEQEATAATQTLVSVGFAAAMVIMAVVVGIFLVHAWTGYFNGILNMDMS